MFVINMFGTIKIDLIQVIGRLELGGEGCEGPELAHWKEIQVTNINIEKT